jgi:hypothetical protein
MKASNFGALRLNLSGIIEIIPDLNASATITAALSSSAVSGTHVNHM